MMGRKKMFCKKCGNQVEDGQAFCGKCGTPVSEESHGADANGERIAFNSFYNEAPMPMAWFKFLIYFSLFAAAVLSFISVGTGITSIIRDRSVYMSFPGILAIELGYAVFNFGYGIFAIITRFALAGYKKLGPLFLYICYGSSALATLAYSILGYVFTNGLYKNPSVIASIAMSVVMIVVNHIYFSKRKHLFVN